MVSQNNVKTKKYDSYKHDESMIYYLESTTYLKPNNQPATYPQTKLMMRTENGTTPVAKRNHIQVKVPNGKIIPTIA